MKDVQKKSRVIEVYSLIFIDLLCMLFSFATAAFFRHVYAVNGPLEMNSVKMAVLLLMLCCAMYNILIDGNRNFFRRDKFTELAAIMKCTFTTIILTLVLMFFLQTAENLSRMVLVVCTVLNIVITYIIHNLYKKWILKNYWKSDGSNKVLIITSQDREKSLLEQIKINIPWNCELVAACVMDAKATGYEINGIPIVANEQNLYDVVSKMALDEVLIDIPDYPRDRQKKLVADLQEMGIVCNCCIHMFHIDGSERNIDSFGGKPVVSYEKKPMDFRKAIVKRLIDIVGALVGLIITAVITPFVAIAIKAESKGPVFFAQERVGRNGRRFKIYKFRSMYLDAEERKKELMEKNQMSGLMFKLDDDPRITKVGKFIRKTSIDELPQFYNILIGEMSLVGTRPPTVDEFNQYNLHYKRRLSMTPGLTGLWQVSGRSSITDFDEVVKLDLEYIDNWSVRLDIKILALTVITVLFRRGAV